MEKVNGDENRLEDLKSLKREKKKRRNIYKNGIMRSESRGITNYEQHKEKTEEKLHAESRKKLHTTWGKCLY